MNRKQADIAVGILVASILVLGILAAVQFFLADDAMTGPMGSAPAMRSVGPLLMSLVVASIVGGVYVFVRGQVFESEARPGTQEESGRNETGMPDAADMADQAQAETADRHPTDPNSHNPVLDLLPDDERAILEPVIESPGLTQIEVRDRSDFSKSKVSQTITDLEKRGLLYRERQGRTYRVYPADDLDERV